MTRNTVLLSYNATTKYLMVEVNVGQSSSVELFLHTFLDVTYV